MNDDFRLFCNQAIKFKTLTEEEREELLKRYFYGDKSVFEKLVKGNLGLVSYVIDKYYKNYKEEEKEDFFQEGIVGLELSIKNFDINREIKFSTYAIAMINGMIRSYKRDNNLIKLSRKQRDIMYKIQVGNLQCYSIPEIANMLGEDEKSIIDILSLSIVNLDEPIDEDGKIFISDTIQSDINIEKEYDSYEEIEELKQAIEFLDERDAHIIKMYYGIDCEKKGQMEMANIFNTSQAQISRIIGSIYRKLEKIINSENFMLEENRRIKSNKNLYGSFKDYTKEDVDKAINSLNIQYRKLLEFKFGLNNKKILSDEELIKMFNYKNMSSFYNSISRIKKNILKILMKNNTNKPLMQSNVDLIISEEIESAGEKNCKSEQINLDFETCRKYIKTILEQLPDLTQKTVLILRLGFIKNKFFSTSEIAEFLKIDEQEVKEIERNALKNIYNIQDESLEKIKKILNNYLK